MRNGMGIMRSIRGNLKLKAHWSNDKPFGKAILEIRNIFIAIANFKDGVPSGEFSFEFPESLAKANGEAKLVGEYLHVKGEGSIFSIKCQARGFFHIRNRET